MPPPVRETRGEGLTRATVEIKPALMRWVCAMHNERIEEQRDWQQQAKDRSHRLTKEAKRRLQRDQMRLL